ncbi:MAG: hypothetical protein ACE5GB_14670 [Acidimicrobiales bacterium]
MYTTGFKYFFGLGLALLTAAIVYGYASGGGNVGPISMGYKGGVGDQLGYGMLVALGFVSSGFGLALVWFRDADPAAQAHLLGVTTVPTNPRTTGSVWPVVGAFGAATVVVGLVLHAAVFVLGLVILAIVMVEWTMDAWADRATGDPAANRMLRNRLMAPVEIPVLGAGGVALAVLAVSRVLLSVSEDGAVIVAGLVAVSVLAGGAIYALKPGIGRDTVATVALVGAIGLLVAGLIAAVVGERDFEHHDGAGETGAAEVLAHE